MDTTFQYNPTMMNPLMREDHLDIKWLRNTVSVEVASKISIFMARCTK